MCEEMGAGAAPVYVTVLLFVSIILLAPLLLSSPSNLSFLLFIVLFHVTTIRKLMCEIPLVLRPSPFDPPPFSPASHLDEPPRLPHQKQGPYQSTRAGVERGGHKG